MTQVAQNDPGSLCCIYNKLALWFPPPRTPWVSLGCLGVSICKEVLEPKAVNHLVNQMMQDTGREFSLLCKTSLFLTAGLLLVSSQRAHSLLGNIFQLAFFFFFCFCFLGLHHGIWKFPC